MARLRRAPRQRQQAGADSLGFDTGNPTTLPVARKLQVHFRSANKVRAEGAPPAPFAYAYRRPRRTITWRQGRDGTTY